MSRLAKLWWGLVRFGFRLLYNEMAFTYDMVSKVVSLGAWRSWQRSALKHLPAGKGLRVLELAYGTGNLHLDLHEAGYEVVGCDLSPFMARITQQKFARQKRSARLVQGKAQQLPFRDKSFQGVVSTFPTDFIIQAATIREVHRVLDDGGVFVIVPNGVLTGGGVLEIVLEWLYKITGQREHSEGDQLDSIRRFFEPYGFEVELFREPCPHSIAEVIRARKRV